MKKVRLDVLMVERGLAESRQQAQRLIMAGDVMIGDARAEKSAQPVPPDAPVRVRATAPFVSRGGLKLDAALKRFGVDVTGYVCADVGASTGGFSDCLLQHGAAKVYAIDVGYGQLDWRLRQDARVVVMERTNARYLDALPEPLDLATVDVSFISLDIILPVVSKWLSRAGQVIALVKPQFEAGRAQVSKGGVVRQPAIHQQVLERILSGAGAHALEPAGLMPSPLVGPAGNIEFLVHLRRADAAAGSPLPDGRLSFDGRVETLVQACLAEVRGQPERRAARGG